LILPPAPELRTEREPGPTAEGLVGTQAPAIVPGGVWINAIPTNLAALRGKVILLEFWTYGCHNCRNTIPALNAWYRKYGGERFVIIGVHTPEFPRERELKNLREEILRLGIRYPVVTDNGYGTWEAYRQRFWPALYLIDRLGIVRYFHAGEGDYEEIEGQIRSQLGLGK
jgi:thiol-disulfide isomerase/thioredoxin